MIDIGVYIACGILMVPYVFYLLAICFRELSTLGWTEKVRQVQIRCGENSATIQAAGDLTITAAGGSVAALQIGSVSIGKRAPTRQRREALAVESVKPAAQRIEVAEIPVRPFAAHSDCPGCGEFAVHPWRSAGLADYLGVVSAASLADYLGRTLEAQTAQTVVEAAVRAQDQIVGVVVRQCLCGQEWREQ